MRNLFLLVAIIVAVSCKSYKTPEKSPVRIQISEGGGFTGAVRSWYLLDNGQVFLKKEKDTAFSKVKSISKEIANTYFSSAAKLFATEKRLPKNPLNYSRTIYYYHNNEASMAIWSPGDKQFADLDDFYSKLLAEMEKANPAVK